MYLRSTIQWVPWIHIVIPTDRATCIQGLQYSEYPGYTLSYQLTEQHVSKVYNTVSTLDTHCHTNWQSNMFPRSTIQWVLLIHIVIPTDRARCLQGLQYSVYSRYTLSYQLTEQHVKDLQYSEYSEYTLSYQLTEQHVSKVYNTVSTLDTNCHTNW